MAGKPRKHKAKDGTISYWIRVELPPDPTTGKRKQERQSFTTKRAAEAAIVAAEAKIDAGTYVPRTDMTVADLLWTWYETTAALKPLTRQSYERTIRVHLVPGLGRLTVQRLTCATLEQWYLTKHTQGVGRRSLQLCHQRLHQALDLAVRWGLAPGNVAASARLPDAGTEERPEMRTWSLQDCHRFLAVAPESRLGPLWTVILGTGLRIGEALGLRWCDLDLDRGDLRVVQAVEPIHGKPTPQEKPKTDSSRRTLHLLPPLVTALREHRARQAETRLRAGPAWHDLDLVFPARNGNPLRHKGYEADLDRLAEKAGVERITVHELRHTFASRSLEEGVPLEIVSKLLGHADISITARIYAHITQDMLRKGARTAGAALFPGLSATLQDPAAGQNPGS